ncbi:MAG: undecaprenyl-diphosphate phosphatase [Bacteroidetes bacterium]|nr:undecaprenyl-diphosphate phosphatase [Bacteroidota bacterium]
MSLLEAVVLGIVQGLTEFIPISSTAHLRIVPAFFGWEDPGAAFTAVTQIGTLIAVLVFFRRDIATLSAAFVRSVLAMQPFQSSDSRMAWWILFGTIPIGVFGLLFKELIETDFRSLYVIAFSLIGLALLLLAAERLGKRSRSMDGMRFSDTQLIGLAQALALIPGASRSGTTITAGLLLNLRREDAARFSFLLSIPAIGLSGLYQLYELRNSLVGEIGIALLIAVVVSGIIGYLSIAFLLRYLRNHSTGLFIGYRIILGIVILVMISMQHVQP